MIVSLEVTPLDGALSPPIFVVTSSFDRNSCEQVSLEDTIPKKYEIGAVAPPSPTGSKQHPDMNAAALQHRQIWYRLLIAVSVQPAFLVQCRPLVSIRD